MPKRIHVIINPAAGQPEPILHALNNVFRPARVRWDVSITQKSGDARRFAREAASAGVDVVAAYGGDGSVMEVAHGLMGSEVPMAILPGGTANLMSVELGIPRKLAEASQVACSEKSQVRMVDIGQVGERYFLLRVGIGFAAEKVRIADRELKNKYGILAYSIGALKAVKVAQTARYLITIDGKHHTTEGLTCLIDNAGNLGIAGLSASKRISVSDGLLDVIIVRDFRFSAWVAMTASVTDRQPNPDYFHHWQGSEISITTEPPLSIQGDGEMWGQTPVSVKVIPQAIRVLVP